MFDKNKNKNQPENESGSCFWFLMTSHLSGSDVTHLVEASRCAVFAAWRQVPQLDVQEVHQLDHGLHRVADVSRLQITFGLLGQLAGNDCCSLSSFQLDGGKKKEIPWLKPCGSVICFPRNKPSVVSAVPARSSKANSLELTPQLQTLSGECKFLRRVLESIQCIR